MTKKIFKKPWIGIILKGQQRGKNPREMLKERRNWCAGDTVKCLCHIYLSSFRTKLWKTFKDKKGWIAIWKEANKVTESQLFCSNNTLVSSFQMNGSLEQFTSETVTESKQDRRMQEDFLSEWINGLVFQGSQQDLEVAGMCYIITQSYSWNKEWERHWGSASILTMWSSA